MKILKLIGNKITNVLYNLPRILFINFYRFFLRIKISYPEKIPHDHSVIFAFNHTIGSDPIIALGVLKRKIHFIADSDRFSNRFTTFFMRKCANSTPIFKNEFLKNIKSFKELFAISGGNKIFFGIFPEGDLFKKGKFGKFKNGAAYLSYKTKLPIVPVYMHNINLGPTDEGWVRRHPVFEGIASLFMNTYRRVHVLIGDPIDPVAENILEELREIADKNEYKKIIDKITKELEKEFLELKEEANIFSISKKSIKVQKPARVQKPSVSIIENSNAKNAKTKRIETLNSTAGQLKTASAGDSINRDGLLDFDEDEELIINPVNAK